MKPLTIFVVVLTCIVASSSEFSVYQEYRTKRTYAFPPTKTEFKTDSHTVLITDVNINNNGTNFAIVAPGAQVNVTFSWTAIRGETTECPTCPVQWNWGLTNTDNNMYICQEMGTNQNITDDTFGTFSENVTAPTTPGRHFLSFTETLEPTCKLDGEISFSKCGEQAWGAICVEGDSDGDSVPDCYDTCPCKSNPSQGPPEEDCPLIVSASSPTIERACGGSCIYQSAAIPSYTPRSFSCDASQATKGFYKYRWSLYGCGAKFEAVSECDWNEAQRVNIPAYDPEECIGSFTPLPKSPFLWLDASFPASLTTTLLNIVQRWDDRRIDSTNKLQLYQTEVDKAPSVVPQAINGQFPAVRFSPGKGMKLTGLLKSAEVHRPFHMYMVLSSWYAAGVQGRSFYSIDHEFVFGTDGNNLVMYAPDPPTLIGQMPITKLNYPYIIEGFGDCDGTTGFFVDNQNATKVTYNMMGIGQIALGKTQEDTPSKGHEGYFDLAELIIFCGVLNNQERAQVYEYLKGKYFPEWAPNVMNATYTFEGVGGKDNLTVGDEVQWEVTFSVVEISETGKCFELEYNFTTPSTQRLLPGTVNGSDIDIIHATPYELVVVVNICEGEPGPHLVNFVTIITSCSAGEPLDNVSTVKNLETGITHNAVLVEARATATCNCQTSEGSWCKIESSTIYNWNPIPSIVEKRIPFLDEECWLAQEIELEDVGLQSVALQIASESTATGIVVFDFVLVSGAYDPDSQTPFSAARQSDLEIVGASLAEIAIDGPFKQVLTVDFCLEPVAAGIYTIYFQIVSGPDVDITVETHPVFLSTPGIRLLLCPPEPGRRIAMNITTLLQDCCEPPCQNEGICTTDGCVCDLDSGFVGLTCEVPYYCVNETSSGSTDKALVFGCNNEPFGKIDVTNQTEFGTIVLVNTVSMNITGTTVESLFCVSEFPTESFTVGLLQVSPPSSLVVDVGYDNNLFGDIQVRGTAVWRSGSVEGGWHITGYSFMSFNLLMFAKRAGGNWFW